jgi:hypothetical protein
MFETCIWSRCLSPAVQRHRRVGSDKIIWVYWSEMSSLSKTRCVSLSRTEGTTQASVCRLFLHRGPSPQNYPIHFDQIECTVSEMRAQGVISFVVVFALMLSEKSVEEALKSRMFSSRWPLVERQWPKQYMEHNLQAASTHWCVVCWVKTDGEWNDWRLVTSTDMFQLNVPHPSSRFIRLGIWGTKKENVCSFSVSSLLISCFF